jgi:hypothetical protein
MGATEKIAGFVVDTGYEDIPRDAVEKAKRTATVWAPPWPALSSRSARPSQVT